VGLSPDPFTLRELLWLAEGAFNHTALLAAAIWSANPCLKRPRVFGADEFNPYPPGKGKVRRSGVRITAANIDLLERAFCGPTQREC
jgi:hypothetical protein